MKHQTHALGIVRLSLVAGALIVLLVSVTFAAMRTQDTIIQGNTMTSASANMLLSQTSGGIFSDTMAGFTFNEIEPGAGLEPQSPHTFYVQNTGTTNLETFISINPERIQISDNMDPSRARLRILDNDRNEPDMTVVEYTVANLIAAFENNEPLPLNIPIPKNQTVPLYLQMRISDVPGQNDTAEQMTIHNMDVVMHGLSTTT